jgi:hypothetical protein
MRQSGQRRAVTASLRHDAISLCTPCARMLPSVTGGTRGCLDLAAMARAYWTGSVPPGAQGFSSGLSTGFVDTSAYNAGSRKMPPINTSILYFGEGRVLSWVTCACTKNCKATPHRNCSHKPSQQRGARVAELTEFNGLPVDAQPQKGGRTGPSMARATTRR